MYTARTIARNTKIRGLISLVLALPKMGRRNHFVPLLLCSYYTALLGIAVPPIVRKAHVTSYLETATF